MGKEFIGSLELNRIYQRDCLEGMQMIPDKSVDMILCDLPYGTTRNKWDSVIDLDEMWAQYERIIKDNGAIVLTAQTPFDKVLGASNLKLLKYEWIWQKEKGTGHLNAKKMPMKNHENILVFYKKTPTYNPQMEIGEKYNHGLNHFNNSTNYNGQRAVETKNDGMRYPKTIQYFKRDSQFGKALHPTQKPVELFEYLIRTYTNEGETVLDNCMGSGTTAVAAIRSKRKFIGFETEAEYIEISNNRLDNEVSV